MKTHVRQTDLRTVVMDKVLPRVEKPVRYAGGELGAVHKNWDEHPVRFVFAFPDVYEVGMSHLGLQILYHSVNREEGMLMERTFAPWLDMENLMRTEQIPLYALESFRPVRDFDLLGFTLQYEMSYTNILNMLDLAGLNQRREDRTGDDPLVIGGGPCAFNPEPLADFFDLFVIGDAEEVLPRLLGAYREWKASGGGDRERFLVSVCGWDGIYVPGFVDVSWAEDGRIREVRANRPEMVLPVRKALVKDLETAPFPQKPIVPYMDVIHDRVMLEVLRGCTHSCRFCQAGTVYRPVRERSGELLLEQARTLVAATGHEDISLTSLSTADHTQLSELVSRLLDEYREQMVSISLPSLRIDSFSVGVAREISSVRKTGLTFAPEAGSQRMRDVINKGVTEEDLFRVVEEAFGAGWHRIKLYFMIGLPFENEEDLAAIIRLGERVLDLGRKVARERGSRQKVSVTVSASGFVPKPFTPFQWWGQDELETLQRKQRSMKEAVRARNLVFNYHDARLSHLESVFARGDRRLAGVLRRAWELGCRFDSWDEQFRFDLWQQALNEEGLSSARLAGRTFEKEEILPWDHIDAGVRKSYLWQEYEKAAQGALTPDCREAGCTACGICPDWGVRMELKGKRYE